MDQHSESDLKQKLNISIFYDYINANPNAAYEQWQQAQQFHYNLNTISFSDQPAPPLLIYPIIDSQTLASIVAQMMAQITTQQSSPPLLVINFPSLLLQAMTFIIYQFKKLSNITEYNEDRDYLNI